MTDQNNNTQPGEETTEAKLFRAKEYFKGLSLELIDLEQGVDKRAVITEIKANNTMSGANAWMLMCSIVIASIGLDLNSQAVIIGAMLISPLMSPILGIGLSVGINDMNTLKRSLSHFAVALGIALFTSIVYFYLSPFDNVTEQIQARTEPTFLDVLIAFFGGIAGIVSNARKDVSTAIPGVAIATALMPPLCVTGFGIANGSWDIAVSSFYLFFVNTFFVALATFLMVRFLKFPRTSSLDSKANKRNLMYTAFFSLLVSIPSFFIFYRVIDRVSTDRSIAKFIEVGIGVDGVYLDDYQYLKNDSTNTILLKVYGDKINDSRIPEYEQKLSELGLEGTTVQIIPTSEINLDRINQLESEIDGVQHMADRLTLVQKEKVEKDKAISLLMAELNTYRMDSVAFNQMCLELKALHEDIVSVNYALGQSYDYEEFTNNTVIIVVQWSSKSKEQQARQQQLDKLLKVRFSQLPLKVFHDILQ